MTREEAIMKLEMLIDLSQQNELKNMHEALRMAIKALERKKGEWIHHENPKGIFSLECPFCKCWFLHEHLVRNSFCPNCGADMRTEHDILCELGKALQDGIQDGINRGLSGADMRGEK